MYFRYTSDLYWYISFEVTYMYCKIYITINAICYELSIFDTMAETASMYAYYASTNCIIS